MFPISVLGMELNLQGIKTTSIFLCNCIHSLNAGCDKNPNDSTSISAFEMALNKIGISMVKSSNITTVFGTPM